ncbi:MAG: TfoX/Sxy family protein [bacterium]|nr:TfoX/Sxy family protein [bacterium]
MAYDEGLAERIESALAQIELLSHKKMFGGLCFLVGGNMLAGVIGERLMLRVGPELYEPALSKLHAGPMDFTGKAMKGLVYVEPEGFESEEDLKDWLALALGFVATLPPK